MSQWVGRSGKQFYNSGEIPLVKFIKKWYRRYKNIFDFEVCLVPVGNLVEVDEIPVQECDKVKKDCIWLIIKENDARYNSAESP